MVNQGNQLLVLIRQFVTVEGKRNAVQRSAHPLRMPITLAQGIFKGQTHSKIPSRCATS
jgi:hypothetical protein